MDDNAPKENPPPGFNKIDLTQLQGFSFGTQWTQDKSAGRESRQDDRPRREGGPDRRDDRAAPDRRDRRTFRKPAGDPSAPAAPTAPGAPAGGEGGPRREGGGGPESREGRDMRGPRRDFRGGPRREGGEEGGRYPSRGGPQERGPYDSPYFTATFYPEDTSFATLAKTIRASCRTFELFDIAKTVIGKPDRFVVVLQRKTAEMAAGRGSSMGEREPASATAEAKKPAPIAMAVPDGIPFESEDAAIAHVLSKHLGSFFDTAEVEVDPPKGNFQVVNRCGVTGELLGPPNYHRYNQIVQQHHAAKLSRMSFEAFRSKIESVRDPEVINQWVEKMKKTTRYTWKMARASTPASAPASAAETPAVAPTGEGETTQTEAPKAEAPKTETAAPLTFDSLEDARMYLLTQCRDKVVRLVDHARFHGKIIENIPPGEIRRAIEGTLERQRRFPLDTANALRGRLRREGFTIFKKGSKGISYVCAVKRKFRVPGQVFSEGITRLIEFIERNAMVKASELHMKFLGISIPAAPAEGAAPAESALTPEQREKTSRMQGDLVWLVREGYVTEFIDGRLFAPPAMVEARKKEIESSEHDPENFPEAPASAEAPRAEPAIASDKPADVPPPEESPAETKSEPPV